MHLNALSAYNKIDNNIKQTITHFDFQLDRVINFQGYLL